MWFASDNTHGAAPEVLEAVVRANAGHATSYGADETMARVTARIRAIFEAPGGGGPSGPDRHRGERARARLPLPAVGDRLLPPQRPRRGGRMRRAGVLHRRREADAARRRAREDRARELRGSARLHRARRRAQRPEGGADAHQRHRAGRRLHPRRGGGACRDGARRGPAGAHGRRPLRQRARPASAARRPSSPGRPASTP